MTESGGEPPQLPEILRLVLRFASWLGNGLRGPSSVRGVMHFFETGVLAEGEPPGGVHWVGAQEVVVDNLRLVIERTYFSSFYVPGLESAVVDFFVFDASEDAAGGAKPGAVTYSFSPRFSAMENLDHLSQFLRSPFTEDYD